MKLRDRNLHALSFGAVTGPRMAIVVIDRSAESNIHGCLSSIGSQDHPELECLVLDLHNSGRAADAIATAFGGDQRFRVLGVNSEQSGPDALIAALHEIGSGFVSVVDADDSIFPGFVSAHLQTHLALPRNLSQTISPVEMVDDVARTLHSTGSLHDADEITDIGLRPSNRVLRLSTVSNDAFEQLSEGVALVPWSQIRWSGNSDHLSVFRASLLRALLVTPPTLPDMDALIQHLRLYCHLMTRTALIGVSMSRRSIAGEQQTLAQGLAPVLSETSLSPWEQAIEIGHQRQSYLLGELDRFAWMLGTRFWEALDAVSAIPLAERRNYYQCDKVAALFRDHAKKLLKEFGDDGFIDNIGRRFDKGRRLYIAMNAYNDTIPRQLMQYDDLSASIGRKND